MNKLRIFVDFVAPPDALEMLRAGTAGHELIFAKTPIASVLTKAERDPLMAEVDIAFGQPDPDAIERSGQIRWVHISSSGITRYDNPQFRAFMAERKVMLSNSAGVYDEACAVHTLSFMLAQARKLPLSLKSRMPSTARSWQELRNASGTLFGESVLIVGYGAIGKRLTELLRPFGMKVTAFRRKPRGDEGIPVVSEAQLPTALNQADHVVNILPESAETRHFFNRARFALIKKGAIFYNIGRGATVDQDALLEVLRSGQLQAAWLDVTEPEPLPNEHPLWAEPNCFITPHVAGGHADEAKTLVRHFLTNFDRFVRGEPLLDRVM
ncbi:MAG TPA: D-2-hydroxyacid dehydrogenase [Clostridia bacterium]|nr:D-2-hydroxyacid dehydrogenase [Clostridia bacterium]